MITDPELQATEEEVDRLFEEGAVEPFCGPCEQRIERIMEKALFEVVVKDTTGFLFTALGAGLGELAGAMFRSLDGPPNRNHFEDNENRTN